MNLFIEITDDGLRECVDCGNRKPTDEFYRMPTGKDGYARCCKTCAKHRRKQWSKKNRERNVDYYRKNKYGITRNDYEAMVTEQRGRCLICDDEPTDGKGLVVDHCHSTGEVRGLLCRNCNVAIGMMGEDAFRLASAAAYVGKWNRGKERRNTREGEEAI